MKNVVAVLAFFVATPLAAQDLGAPLPADSAVESVMQDEGEDEGLTFTVSDEGAWDDLGIAIAGFASDRDVPTPANSSGTAALGKEIGRVVFADLKNNGLFKPSGPDSLPQPSFAQITAPAWPTWSRPSSAAFR